MTDGVTALGPRISVIGNSGSGKTWTASRLAEGLAVPHVEMDALRHGPNWAEMPDDTFRETIARIAATARWVIDGNYTSLVRDVIWERATGVVWLDYPRSIVMRQVIARSMARALLRKELWNANRERVRDWVHPEHPIRWAWAQHAGKRIRDEEMLVRAGHLTVVRLRSPQQARRWVSSIDAVRA